MGHGIGKGLEPFTDTREQRIYVLAIPGWLEHYF